jgi:hypothetical protein
VAFLSFEVVNLAGSLLLAKCTCILHLCKNNPYTDGLGSNGGSGRFARFFFGDFLWGGGSSSLSSSEYSTYLLFGLQNKYCMNLLF